MRNTTRLKPLWFLKLEARIVEETDEEIERLSYSPKIAQLVWYSWNLNSDRSDSLHSINLLP